MRSGGKVKEDRAPAASRACKIPRWAEYVNHIQQAELYGGNRKEVDRDHLADLISKERHQVLPKLAAKREKWILTPRQAGDLAAALSPKPRMMVVSTRTP